MCIRDRDAKDLFQKSFKTYIDAIKAANAEKKPGEEPLPVPSLSLGISKMCIRDRIIFVAHPGIDISYELTSF